MSATTGGFPLHHPDDDLSLEYDMREYLDDQDRADYANDAYDRAVNAKVISFGTCPSFTSSASDSLELGADALLFVMRTDQTHTIPDDALRFAEKVAICSIQRTSPDVDPRVLDSVNRALDRIAATLRIRQSIANESAVATPTTAPSTKPNEGPMATLPTRPTVRPPAGQKVDIRF